MNVSHLSPDALALGLANEGLRMRIGPFVTHLKTELQNVAESLQFFYGDYALAPDETVSDFHVRLATPPGIRRWYRKQVLFLMDGQNQFQPFPFDLAPPLFEWGLNWCISNRAHQYLIVHSAVVERKGRALLLPARPGSGKSTLCAGLVHRGFRLLSDEHVLLRPEDGHVVAVPRPIALKNESIPVIRQLAPELVLGPSFHDVEKGEVSHVRPPAASVSRANETALPSAVIFPKFDAGRATRMVPLRKAAALMELIDNSVNYGVLGRAGFETLANLVDRSSCAALDYADIEGALDSTGGTGVRDATSLLIAALTRPQDLPALGAAQWDELICRARSVRLLARVGQSFESLSPLGELPERVEPQIRAEYAIAHENERMLRWEVDRIKHALREIPVPIVLLKGAAYAFAALPAAAGRLSSDVDIMVPKASLGDVEAALLRAGWEAVKLDPYDQRYYRTWMHELPPLCHRERHTLVDVHHTILPETGRLHPDASELAAAAHSLGNGLSVLAPADMVLHSAAHLFQDGDLDGGLRDLVDLDSLLTHFGRKETFWSDSVPRAVELDLVRPLFYALRFCDKLFRCPIPEPVRFAADVGAPPPPLPWLMDRLTERAIVPDGWETPARTTRLARFLLYVRSHWLRMPPWLLALHLARKAFSRGFPPPEP